MSLKRSARKDFVVKFAIILVFGVSGWGTFGKEIPEKITKTVSGLNGIIVLLGAFEDIHEKGIPLRTTETKALDCSMARVA